jgi:hypothetical protein
MWHALKAELDYFRPWLAGAFGLAIGVTTLVSGIFWAVGEEGPPSHAAAGIRGMFLVMAPVILGFVIQAMRNEERRTRLLMTTPMTPRDLAWITVLIPSLLFVVGIAGAALMLALERLLTGSLVLESVHIVGFVGGMVFMGTMIGLLIQEAVAAHQQGRARAALAGWGVLAFSVLILAAIQTVSIVFQSPATWPMMHVGNLVAAVAAMAATVKISSARTDFTR